jgi:hypothetical protein
MRRTKTEEECEMCGKNEILNYVDLRYTKEKICDTCLKWTAVLFYNTVRRTRQILGMEEFR